MLNLTTHTDKPSGASGASGYIVEWGNQDTTLIIVQFEPPLTWENIRHAYSLLYALMRSVSQRVDWITDISRDPTLPKGDILRHLRALLARVPENAGMNVVVASDNFTATVLEVFVNAVMWRRGFAIVSSLEEAKTVIAKKHINDELMA